MAASVFRRWHVLLSGDSKKSVPLRLLLLRHAKSDWSGNLGDHDRPLAPRGRKAAPRIGAFMRKKGYVPEAVLCSTAERTKQTLELLLPQLRADPTVRYDRALYLAEWPALLAALMIGHNPGLEQLAVALTLQPQDAAERARFEALERKFPTAALAVLDFDVPLWEAVKPGTGRLRDFVRPRDTGGASVQ
jgi:phosphohistidine phosphatase